MKIIRAIVTELLGLFIDDGALALFTVGLIAIVCAAIKLLEISPIIGGIALFIGYVAILAESVLRFSRQKRK